MYLRSPETYFTFAHASNESAKESKLICHLFHFSIPIFIAYSSFLSWITSLRLAAYAPNVHTVVPNGPARAVLDDPRRFRHERCRGEIVANNFESD